MNDDNDNKDTDNNAQGNDDDDNKDIDNDAQGNDNDNDQFASFVEVNVRCTNQRPWVLWKKTLRKEQLMFVMSRSSVM